MNNKLLLSAVLSSTLLSSTASVAGNISDFPFRDLRNIDESSEISDDSTNIDDKKYSLLEKKFPDVISVSLESKKQLIKELTELHEEMVELIASKRKGVKKLKVLNNNIKESTGIVAELSTDVKMLIAEKEELETILEILEN